MMRKKWLSIVGYALLFVIGYKIIDNTPKILGYLSSIIGILKPFIIGAVIAFFLDKPVIKLCELYGKARFDFVKKNARSLSIASVYVLFLLVAVFVIGFLVDAIYKNIAEIIANWDTISARAIAIFDGVNLPQKYLWLDKINAFLSGLLENELLLKAGNIVGDVASTLVAIVTGFVISIYMILEKDSLKHTVRICLEKICRSSRIVTVNQYVKRMVDMFYSYFTSLALDAVIIGAVSTIFYIIFGAPYPWLLGLVVAIGNMIPFFGPIAAAIVVTLVSAVGLGPLSALWVLLFQIILGQVDGNVIQPRIVGGSVGISPFWVIFAVLLFGGLFGAAGMLLGVPIVAVLRMLVLEQQKPAAAGATEDAPAEPREEEK